MLRRMIQKTIIGVLLFLLDIYLIAPIVKLQDILSSSMVNLGGVTDISAVGTMYTNPILCLKYILNPDKFGAWFIASAVIWALIICIFFLYKGNNSHKVAINGKTIDFSTTDGTYGTAKFMSLQELSTLGKYLDMKSGTGIIYGRLKESPKHLITINSDSWFNRNVAVIGSSGSRKSRAVARPNIFNLALLGESMVITDPKGELAQDTIPLLQSLGYTWKVLNFVNMVHSDRWNPLNEVTDDLSAQTFAQVVIENTNALGAKDDFWSKTEKNLLIALALYIAMELPKKDANMGVLYGLIATKDTKRVERIFEILDDSHPAVPPYNIYKQAGEAVRTGVIIGLGTRLAIFQSKLVQKVTEESEIDIKLLATQKCAYFIVVPDSESTFDFLAGLFFSFAFIKLTKIADYNGGKLERQVNFILDEFPNIAKIPDFKKKISTIRSRGVNTFVIFQNIAQLQNRYPNNEWAEILSACDTTLFLGCNEEITSKYISDKLGIATINDYTTKKEQGLDAIFDFGSKTDKRGKRMLKNPDEVNNYPTDNAILMMRGQNPLELIKYDYTEHKLGKRLKGKKLKDYHKAWATDFEELEKKNEEMYSILRIKSDINIDSIDKLIPEIEVKPIETANIKQTPNVQKVITPDIKEKNVYLDDSEEDDNQEEPIVYLHSAYNSDEQEIIKKKEEKKKINDFF
jgi:type IV secretion system protein VirD4